MKTECLILKSAVQAAISASAVLLVCAVCTGALDAQTPKPRIAAPVDTTVRATLAGSVPHDARPEFDLGEAPAATQMSHIRLIFARSSEQQVALDSYLAELIDTSSPSYHKWLTPDEFGRFYGPAESDIAAVRDWLESEGLSEVSVPKGRASIEFSGSIASIERAFQTSIHSFRDGEREFLANVTDPSIPSALAPLVKGIVDLNTIPPETDLVRGPGGRYNPLTGQLEAGDGVDPEYTGTRNGNPFLFLTPGDVATMYNTPNETLNANFAGGSTYDGSGVIIGVIGAFELTSSSATPISNWRKLFLPAKYPLKLTITNVDGTTNLLGVDEAFLDIETAGGIAPGAAMHFYASYPTILPAITQALDDNTVDILNVSFGKCEKTAGNSDNQAILADWQQAAAQGIAVTVSAGDTGSARCDTNGSNEASEGLAVNYFASTPYNVAVGGTDMYGLLNNFSEYVQPSTSDASKAYYRTLINPVPESTWNDSQANSTAVPGPISKAVVFRDTVNAGGGGASSCSTQSTSGVCTSGNPKPSWQSAKGVPDDHVRDLPDVALMSGVGSDSAAWLVCSNDLGSCALESGQFSFTGIGGTSAAAPTFAGMLALVEQKSGDRLGQEAEKNLYDLYNNFGTRAFNDITLGNNAPPCYTPSQFLSSPDCVKNKAGYYFESGYNSGTGYDQASGLGSVNATSLVEFWGAAAPLPATVTVKPLSSSVFRGDSLAVTVTVTGKSGTPSGTVELGGGGFVSKAKSLSGGKATFAIPANVLAAGTDLLTANYSGDSRFDEAAGKAKVTVTQLTPTVKVAPAASTTPSSKSLAVTVQVLAAAGTPAGTVTLSSGNYTSPATVLAGGKAKITIPANKLVVGTDTLTAVYKGSADYKQAKGHASIKVTK